MIIVHRDKNRIRSTRRHKVERPYSRKDGRYQFLIGWNADGSAKCLSVTKQQVIDSLFNSEGQGVLEDDGRNLWWVQAPLKRGK
jgi:hypothetical protein